MAARTTSRRKGRFSGEAGLFGLWLDPIDRLSETIYSVLIILTFTLAFRIFQLGDDPSELTSAQYATELLVAAFSATLAWGLIDGVMYALMEVFQRSERHRLLWQIQTAETEQEGVDLIAEELDYILEPIAGQKDRRALYRSALGQLRRSEPRPVSFKREDFLGALGSVLVAIVAVLPSLAPLFLLRDDYTLAVRVSNVISFIVLFVAGYSWGRHTGASPWRTGLLLVAVGALLVAIAIPLGG